METTSDIVAWDQVDHVILDMDGTILDLSYDNYFWRELVPQRYAQINGLTLEQARDIALVLRPSLLLDALLDLFETMWERAAPFGTAAVSVPRSEKARRAIDFDRLVSLLAAGMNDKSIAQELGVSARTLERRILDLVKVLDARTRFQAGWQAAHRSSAKKNGQS